MNPNFSRPNKNKSKKQSKNVRSSAKLSGQGDYTVRDFVNSAKPILKDIVKQTILTTGSALGGAVSGAAGVSPAIGTDIGRKLASRISKLIGTGDYTVSDKVSCNSLFPSSNNITSAAATFGSSGTGVRVRHREYIDDVYATSSSFNAVAYPVQPGLGSTFQYLSQIALNFEEYYVHGMVFEFISTTSPYYANGAMGSVMMAMQYDAALPPFTSKPQLENSDYAISGRPDVSLMYGIECKDQPMNGYYIRSGASLANQPINFTDLGTFYMATQTPIPSGTNLGELWVTYDIEFRRPHITPARFGYCKDSWVTTTPGTTPVLITTPGNSILYGSLLGRSVTGSSGSVLYNFPYANPGDIYEVQIIVGPNQSTLSSPVVTSFGAPTLSGMSLVTNFTTGSGFNSASSRSTTITGVTTTTGIFPTLFYTAYIQILPNVANPSFSIPLPVLSGALATFSVDVIFIDIAAGVSL